jgi:chaperonin cofactor prefoldin
MLNTQDTYIKINVHSFMYADFLVRMEDSTVVSSLRIQVKTLKDRVHILNGQLEDTDAEWKQKVDNLQQVRIDTSKGQNAGNLNKSVIVIIG